MNYTKSPYKEIPTELISSYTQDGNIPILKWWKDGSRELAKSIWDDDYLGSYMSHFSNYNIRNKRVTRDSYSGGSKMVLEALEKYKIFNKDVAVIGTTSPWIEAILLNNKNSVTTIEYNTPILKTNKLKTIDYFDFEKTDIKYDCIISYSSIEHSGLGRYGDPLDPNGDLKSMDVIFNHLNPDSLLLFGAPFGKDALVWNVHRVYGNKRLPLLFAKFTELEWIGHKRRILRFSRLKNNGKQPLVVLKPNK